VESSRVSRRVAQGGWPYTFQVDAIDLEVNDWFEWTRLNATEVRNASKVVSHYAGRLSGSELDPAHHAINIRPDLLVFTVPPVPPGSHPVKLRVADIPLPVGELVVQSAYGAPANSRELLDQFVGGSESVFLGLESTMKAQIQSLPDEREREELMLYLANFASSSRALFCQFKAGIMGSDAETVYPGFADAGGS
jgi:hypothetical protein